MSGALAVLASSKTGSFAPFMPRLLKEKAAWCLRVFKNVPCRWLNAKVWP